MYLDAVRPEGRETCLSPGNGSERVYLAVRASGVVVWSKALGCPDVVDGRGRVRIGGCRGRSKPARTSNPVRAQGGWGQLDSGTPRRSFIRVTPYASTVAQRKDLRAPSSSSSTMEGPECDAEQTRLSSSSWASRYTLSMWVPSAGPEPQMTCPSFGPLLESPESATCFDRICRPAKTVRQSSRDEARGLSHSVGIIADILQHTDRVRGFRCVGRESGS